MEVADRLGHKLIDLAGFSWGGALAQQVAIQFPGRIRRLVLMATTPNVGAPGIGWATLLDDDMLASGLRLPTATPPPASNCWSTASRRSAPTTSS